MEEKEERSCDVVWTGGLDREFLQFRGRGEAVGYYEVSSKTPSTVTLVQVQPWIRYKSPQSAGCVALSRAPNFLVRARLWLYSDS